VTNNSVDETGQRHRAYAWQALNPAAHPLSDQSGLVYFQRLKDGLLPPQPIMQTIGWRLHAVAFGHLTLQLSPEEFLFHGAGLLHGGVIATVLDSAMSGAAFSTMAQGEACTTVQLNVHYVAAVHAGVGSLIIDGKVRQRGGQVITAEGSVQDGQGKLFAHATCTCVVRKAKSVS
jgi:uncharacterized protein (TIGR00369 family)